MPRILFTSDPKLPRDLVHLAYRKGVEVELSSDLCERWIRRGVAIYAKAEAPAEAAEAPAEAAEAPESATPFEAKKAEIKRQWRRK